jgi:hypothetical protein
MFLSSLDPLRIAEMGCHDCNREDVEYSKNVIVKMPNILKM